MSTTTNVHIFIIFILMMMVILLPFQLSVCIESNSTISTMTTSIDNHQNDSMTNNKMEERQIFQNNYKNVNQKSSNTTPVLAIINNSNGNNSINQTSRVYLIKGNLNSLPYPYHHHHNNNFNNQNDSFIVATSISGPMIVNQQMTSSLSPPLPPSLPPSSPTTPQLQLHIYFFFFIGFMPACLCAFVWWIQNRCFRNLFCFRKKPHDNDHHQHYNHNYHPKDHHRHHRHHNNNNRHDGDGESNDNINDEININQNSFYNNNKKLRQQQRYNNQLIPVPNNFQSISKRNGTIVVNNSRPVYSSYEIPRKSLEMIEILGEGNFGQVWKAKSYYFNNSAGGGGGRGGGGDKSIQLVAVKTNKLTTSETNETQEDLLKELDIMVQLGSHPNVVRLLGCCTENTPYYIVMEYVSQGKLLSYLRQHRDDYFEVIDGKKNDYSLPKKIQPQPPPPQTTTTAQTSSSTTKSFINDNNNYMTYYPNQNYGQLNHNNSNNNKKLLPGQTKKEEKNSLTPYDLIQFAYQISKGMEFISSHGIIHRDLAVRNILIDENRNCKVADFGLSRSIRDKDTDMYEMKHGGQVPVRWMSPEALTMGIFSIKSDVWAFGIVLWEIVTLGSTPYIGMSAPEVINYIRQGNICSQPQHCNEDLYDLMKSCWAYKADDRFTFTQIKYHLMRMLLAIQEDRENYIDLENFNNSLYYFNTSSSPDEKL